MQTPTRGTDRQKRDKSSEVFAGQHFGMGVSIRPFPKKP
jgi:hypothetical protein